MPRGLKKQVHTSDWYSQKCTHLTDNQAHIYWDAGSAGLFKLNLWVTNVPQCVKYLHPAYSDDMIWCEQNRHLGEILSINLTEEAIW